MSTNRNGSIGMACAGLGAAALLALSPPVAAQRLPAPVTNNAVAHVRQDGELTIYSFLGLDSTRQWSGITTRAVAWNSAGQQWTELPAVPGVRGRLGATAQAVRGRVYLFGGYTVDSSGAERSVPEVDVWDPGSNQWMTAAPMPLPVDDAVSGVWRDSLVYLVSGWHDTDNTTRVQIYDPARNQWREATPIPGPGVFGHTGGIAGNTIVFVDGVVRNSGRPRYSLVRQAWAGEIDPLYPERIAWRRLPEHPGPPLYRAAGGSCASMVVIAGGSDNPYNYDGIGYDGAPAEPRNAVLGYDVRTGSWRSLGSMPVASMDHRGLLVDGGRGWVVGGMRSGQRVSAELLPFDLPACATAGATPAR